MKIITHILHFTYLIIYENVVYETGIPSRDNIKEISRKNVRIFEYCKLYIIINFINLIYYFIT